MTHTFELGTDGPSTIVVGVDGSDTSLRAGAYAWGLARRHGAHLVIVHATPVGGLGGVGPGGAAALRGAAEEFLTALRADIAYAMRHHPVSHTLVHEPGDPYGVLTRTADTHRADSVVVGASTQAGHRLVGSVAVKLVRVGRWPVTVVP